MDLIHKTAIIEGNIKLGSNVKVGPYALISGNIEIGNDTEIGHCVQIEGNVIIGRNNKIYHSAYIGAPPQDVSYTGENSNVEIGDNNNIREFVQIHRGTKQDTTTRVGDNCFLMGGVHLAHNTKVGNFVTIANNSLMAGYVEIDDYTFISGVCAIHQFVKVGKHAILGGLSRITKDCLPFMIIEGNPARVAGVNSVGLKRNEFSPERRKMIKEAYKIICRSNKNVSQAVEKLSAIKNNKDIEEIINFIRSSERGIIK